MTTPPPGATRRTLTVLAALGALACLAPAANAGSGRAVASYEAGDGAQPAWAARAVRDARHQLARVAPLSTLRLARATRDDLGLTHVRFTQVHRGVPVFGTALIAELDARGQLVQVYGSAAALGGVASTPAISAARALSAARRRLAPGAVLASAPTAALTVLPARGAARTELTYKVTLPLANASARHVYFVDARDGSIVDHYDAISDAAETGTGNARYYGSVPLTTDAAAPGGPFVLRDPTRGNTMTRGCNPSCTMLVDDDNVWGDGTDANPQTAAVDAQLAATLTWDYYADRQGWLGLDGAGRAFVGNANNPFIIGNAFWDGSEATFGAAGSGIGPMTSIDIVGHEYSHGIVQFTAGFFSGGDESAALNESFADIFGTAIEFYGGTLNGREPDYLFGEDPSSPGGFRSLAHPAVDHVSLLQGEGHEDGGVSNNAFYLLAEGGTNGTSGLSVTGIGRERAEDVFFRALHFKLTPAATFADVRLATIAAAGELYGEGSAEQASTAQAWLAVGVMSAVEQIEDVAAQLAALKPGQPAGIQSALQKAIDALIGKQGGAGTTGAADRLAVGDVASGVSKLAAAEVALAPIAEPDVAPQELRLAQLARVIAYETVAEAREATECQNLFATTCTRAERRAFNAIAARVDAGDEALFGSGDYAAAVTSYKGATAKAVGLLA